MLTPTVLSVRGQRELSRPLTDSLLEQKVSVSAVIDSHPRSEGGQQLVDISR